MNENYVDFDCNHDNDDDDNNDDDNNWKLRNLRREGLRKDAAIARCFSSFPTIEGIARESRIYRAMPCHEFTKRSIGAR